VSPWMDETGGSPPGNNKQRKKELTKGLRELCACCDVFFALLLSQLISHTRRPLAIRLYSYQPFVD